jgi:hypothetical protein
MVSRHLGGEWSAVGGGGRANPGEPPIPGSGVATVQWSGGDPSTIAINVNAPMPAGAIHVDIPSFRGGTRDRYPIQLLQVMGSSGLFEPWRIIEAGAVVWFYEGAGGEFDYWPEGLIGFMQSERQPLTNRALVADNDRMYHRIGWIGEPTSKIPIISPAVQIEHISGAGWVISDGGREVQRYPDEQIRISILWKGRVKTVSRPEEHDEIASLTPERIVQIFQSDLGVHTGACLTDEGGAHGYSSICSGLNRRSDPGASADPGGSGGI